MPAGTAVFVDTSIQIARFVHSDDIKRAIRTRLKSFDITATGLVVRQEFKRRLLKEARYLLDQLKQKRSYDKVVRHVNDVLPVQQRRKKQICMQTLLTVSKNDTDEDRTDRAKLFMRHLLKHGLDEFDGMVDHLEIGSGCACATNSIIEKQNGKFDFGPEKCSETAGKCAIVAFLKSKTAELETILARLKTIQSGTKPGQKTEELERAEGLIESFLRTPDDALVNEPCLKVGDLLVALESARFPSFYTMNGKESQHLCKPLGQDLIVRPVNPQTAETECNQKQAEWPAF
jgi:hypothetical protein